jgi:hypothetical protein
MVSVLALVLVGCSPPPEEVSSGSEGTSDTNATATRGDGTRGTQGSGTAGTSDATTSGRPTTDGSGLPPGCTGPEGCAPNEICEQGECIEACGGRWGTGSYHQCLDGFGVFATDELCGPDHVCVFWGDPIGQTACAFQGCTEACDCPPPAATGTATVTCGEITDPADEPDCYLGCADGEQCPDDMACNDGGVCVTDVPELSTYGDCGNVGAGCVAPGFCVLLPTGESVCSTSCAVVGECPIAVPPGGGATLACSDITPDVGGFECYLSCIGFACPDGMTCVNGTLCMWPG